MDLNGILGHKDVELTDTQFLLLSYNQKLIEIDINRVYLEYQRTKVYWLNLTNRTQQYQKYSEEIIRSVLVLKLMTFQTTGAILAALTTSIPETIGEVRNWDYRFCWLRDASMSVDTLLKVGHYKSAQGFLGYIKRILQSKHDTFQIMYGIRGERALTEIDLPHLSGYCKSKPVRIGNAAYTQKQNDVFGYLLNVIFQYYVFFPGTLDEIEEMWETVRNITRTVTAQWGNPDKGIWEIRKGEKHFVFSKVMSWVAMDRAAKIAKVLNKSFYADVWQHTADDIKQDVLNKGWKEDLQTFTQTYCNSDLDASLLLMAEYGFIDAGDIKYKNTVIAVKNALYHNGLMYRYINADDFGHPTSSFTICTFWLIQALYKTGETEGARIIFDNLLACGNHLGLLSEDIDFATKRLLGNFPQAYSHLALINTARLFSEEKHISKFIKP
jgi:GH15 family glucan-1,4-alpha-glucosidase